MSDVPSRYDLTKIVEGKVTGKTTIGFGKHAGSCLDDLPDSYCWWLLHKCKLDHPFSEYLEDRLEDYEPFKDGNYD